MSFDLGIVSFQFMIIGHFYYRHLKPLPRMLHTYRIIIISSFFFIATITSTAIIMQLSRQSL